MASNTEDTQSPPLKQYLWLVRYGLTEHPLVESLGPFDSDIDPTEGIAHAKSIAQRIANHSVHVPRHVYASPFLRTVHTAHILASALPDGTRVRIEEGLTEWQVPSLLVEPNGQRTFPKSVQDHASFFDTIDINYQSVNAQVPDDVDNPEGAPQFPETEDALVVRCASTLKKILDQDKQESIAIVSHAPCDIAMALHLAGKSFDQAKGLWEPWPLGGLTLFSRPVHASQAAAAEAWTLEFYGDATHMPGEFKNGLKRWTLPAML